MVSTPAMTAVSIQHPVSFLFLLQQAHEDDERAQPCKRSSKVGFADINFSCVGIPCKWMSSHHVTARHTNASKQALILNPKPRCRIDNIHGHQ